MAKFPTGRGTETSKMLPKEQHLADIIVRLTKSWDEERRGQLVAVVLDALLEQRTFEREACARFIETYRPSEPIGTEIAGALRAKKEPWPFP